MHDAPAQGRYRICHGAAPRTRRRGGALVLPPLGTSLETVIEDNALTNHSRCDKILDARGEFGASGALSYVHRGDLLYGSIAGPHAGLRTLRMILPVAVFGKSGNSLISVGHLYAASRSPQKRDSATISSVAPVRHVGTFGHAFLLRHPGRPLPPIRPARTRCLSSGRGRKRSP